MLGRRADASARATISRGEQIIARLCARERKEEKVLHAESSPSETRPLKSWICKPRKRATDTSSRLAIEKCREECNVSKRRSRTSAALEISQGDLSSKPETRSMEPSIVRVRESIRS